MLTILPGDCREVLKTLPDESVHCCVTSPPYWGLRDYGTARWEGGDADCDHSPEKRGSRFATPVSSKQARNRGSYIRHGRRDCDCGAIRIDSQLGLEATPEEYVAEMVGIFREVRRVLRDDGTLWLNLGDSYSSGGRKDYDHSLVSATSGLQNNSAGLMRSTPEWAKPKDLIGIPWLVAFALRADGWYLRSEIIWCLSGGAKVYARTQKGDMPMSVKELVRLDPSTVKLWNGEKWTQALGWSRSPEPRDGALEIELRSGERIGCTPGHAWPTQRGNVRTDELRAGDVIQTTTLPAPNNPVQAEALDESVAWLCGLYLAEGSMNGNTVQLAGHTNQTGERMRRLESIAQRFHGTVRAHVSSENSASICMDGPIVASLIRAYIHGNSSATKGLKTRVWQRDNSFLRALLEGYLAGDGHQDGGRWRLGFTRNDRLAADLRTLTARLGISMRLAHCTVTGFGREWPAYRGDLRLEPTRHHNARENGEVVAVRPGRGRQFWDIGVEDEPHLFALASGVLTHNSKPNPMPESVTDRPTKSHEQVFLLTKASRYFYDAEAIREGSICDRKRGPNNFAASYEARGTGNGHSGLVDYRDSENGSRNRRSVWTIATSPYSDAHFATFPPKLVEPCILAGTSARGCCAECGAPWERVVERSGGTIGQSWHNHENDLARGQRGGDNGNVAADAWAKGDYQVKTTGWQPTCKHDADTVPATVLDPFAGSGTVGKVALELGRKAILIELNPKYCEMIDRRAEVTLGLPGLA